MEFSAGLCGARLGRVLRELDMTNKGKEWTKGNVARTILELVRAGYEDGLRRSALERVSRSSWIFCDLAKRGVKSWTDDEIECWCKS